jgi:hypothetical protein
VSEGAFLATKINLEGTVLYIMSEENGLGSFGAAVLKRI